MLYRITKVLLWCSRFSCGNTFFLYFLQGYWNGVKEYWIVNPSYKFIEVWNGLNHVSTFKDGMTIISTLFPDLTFEVSLVFEKPGSMKLARYLFKLLTDTLRGEYIMTYEELLDLELEIKLSQEHIKVGINLSYLFCSYFGDKKCQIRVHPYEVFLDESLKPYRPDLCVICDSNKLKLKGCVGAPDLIVEILSPSTAYIDISTKKYDYLSNGVKEYWIIDPSRQSIEIWTGLKCVTVYQHNDIIFSVIFPDLTFELSLLFEEPGNFKIIKHVIQLLIERGYV